MTEEQAIQRIWRQLDSIIMGNYTLERRELPELCAKAAWQEMKAIAREDTHPVDIRCIMRPRTTGYVGPAARK